MLSNMPGLGVVDGGANMVFTGVVTGALVTAVLVGVGVISCPNVCGEGAAGSAVL